jgi:hypothetical protein
MVLLSGDWPTITMEESAMSLRGIAWIIMLVGVVSFVISPADQISFLSTWLVLSIASIGLYALVRRFQKRRVE